MVTREYKNLIKSLYKMDRYIIQRIALYVKDPQIVKLLFYIPKYRNLISESDYHYDELVLKYSKIDWMTDNLRMIKSFYRLKIPFDSNISSNHMDKVASNGYFEMLKWLHYNRKEGCTKYAMDNAADNGHIEIVKWLHENRKEGCTIDAMDIAALNGNLEIVKWLHYNRKEGCTTYAMDWAAEKGHLEIVKWLHENREEGCSTYAMDLADRNGHIEVVKWLKENIKI